MVIQSRARTSANSTLALCLVLILAIQNIASAASQAKVSRRASMHNTADPRRIEPLLSRAAADSLRIWTHIQASEGSFFTANDTARLHDKYKDSALRLTVTDGEITAVLPELGTLHRNAIAARDMMAVVHKAVGLPDGLDMVWNMHDSPVVVEEPESYHQPPVFSFCTRLGTADVPITALEFHVTAFDSAELLKQHPWSSRDDVAFWRGSPTGAVYTLQNWRGLPRPQLVNLSLHNSAFVDAKFVGCAQCEPGVWEEMQAELGSDNSGSPRSDSLARHKYLVDIDGNGWSSRLLGQLSLGSVIFKIEPAYHEFFFSLLIPYVHYVPVRRDMSDLVAKIEYAREHDEEMHAIAMAAREFLRSLAGRTWQRHLHDLLYAYHNLFIPPLTDTLTSQQA